MGVLPMREAAFSNSLAVGLILLACFLLFSCRLLHLDQHLQNLCISWWKSFIKSFIPGSGAALPRRNAALPPLPPGRFGLPWVGETLQFNSALEAGDPNSFLAHRSSRFGSKTFKTHLFFSPTAVVQGVAANRFVATSENKHLLLNSWAPSVLRIVGRHVPTAKHGAEHHRLRQVISSCLNPLALQKLVGKTDHITQHHFARCWKGHSHLSICPLLKLHTFRIACSLLTGIEDEATISFLYPHFIAWLTGMMALPLNFPGTAFRKSLHARTVLIREMGNIIRRRQQELAHLELSSTNVGVSAASAARSVSAPTYPEDLLSVLLRARDENGSLLNQDELQDVLLFMLFAGHDTTTSMLAFALKFLEQNPDCYDSIVRENEAISSQKREGEMLKWEDIQEMRYTWWVLQETMRKMPPVVGVLKEAMHELTFDGYKIPKGWKIFFSISGTHHDEKYYPEPTKFDPCRFDPKKKQEGIGPPPFAYVPFGIGPHSCPGNEFARMNACIYLHHLVKNFKWVSMEPNEKVCAFPIPTFSKGYPAKVKEIHP